MVPWWFLIKALKSNIVVPWTPQDVLCQHVTCVLAPLSLILYKHGDYLKQSVIFPVNGTLFYFYLLIYHYRALVIGERPVSAPQWDHILSESCQYLSIFKGYFY